MCLQQWYQQPIGQRVCQAEQQWLQTVLSRTFGYYIVQLGNAQQQWLTASPISHRVYLEPQLSLIGLTQHTTLTGNYEQLPFAAASIDAMVISHVLEFCHDPLQVLAEVYRCLLPEGKVMILCFNSVSLWGLVKLSRIRHKAAPWNGCFIRPATLRSWLAALDYVVDDVVSLVQRPPIKHTATFDKCIYLESLGKRFWPEKAGCYGLIASKRVAGLTPRRSVWCRKKTLLTETAAESSLRLE